MNTTDGVEIDYAKSLKEDDQKFMAAMAREAMNDFEFFYNTIFSISVAQLEGQFVKGVWLDRYCRRLQALKRTSTKAARKHGKTTVLMAYVAWLLFRCPVMPGQLVEYLYVMHSDSLASEKVKRIKQCVELNPYFNHIVDLKPTADTLMEYRNGNHKFELKPAGVFSFKRGKHPDGVIADDILNDPTQALDLTQVQKITDIFERQMTSLPKEGGFLHLAGTAQDETDIFYILEERKGWDSEENKSWIDKKKGIALWPEMFPADRLRDIERNDTGKKAYAREYELEPARSEGSYIDKGDYDREVDKELVNYGVIRKAKEPEFGESYGGLDIGKKSHPSHLAVGQVVTVKNVRYLVQVHSCWFDHVDYTIQIAHCEKAITRFGIVQLDYDATRGELEGFDERGELPGEMNGVTMNAKIQQQMGADIDKTFGQHRIVLLNEDRQRKQFLAVDENFNAPVTPLGHGDAFWSINMMVKAFLEGSSNMLSTG